MGQENLDIPDFLKRSEAMPRASTSKVSKKETPAAVKAKPTKGKAKDVGETKDIFGYRIGSTKSKAAAMYATKGGATVEEVKKATGSVQLNLIKDCEEKGFTVQRLKEDGSGKRQVTRYFLSAKK